MSGLCCFSSCSSGLGCPVAGGIIVPCAEIEPAFAALEGGFFTCGPPGKPLTPRFIEAFSLTDPPSTVYCLYLSGLRCPLISSMYSGLAVLFPIVCLCADATLLITEALCVCSVMSNSLQPMDHSPPGSSVHGILPARILVWVALPLSGGSS